MNQEVENHIRNNTTWTKLPNNIRQVKTNKKQFKKKSFYDTLLKVVIFLKVNWKLTKRI
jgi:hypothetical protein